MKFNIKSYCEHCAYFVPETTTIYDGYGKAVGIIVTCEYDYICANAIKLHQKYYDPQEERVSE